VVLEYRGTSGPKWICYNVTLGSFMLFKGLTLTTFPLTANNGSHSHQLETLLQGRPRRAVVVPEYRGNLGAKWIVTVDNFMFFHVFTLTEFPLTACKMGLMFISLERYFKIVHAVAHRKYYRNWMTKVGVALPWITGAISFLFPAMGATRVVNGTCLRMAVWPNKAMASVSTLFDLYAHHKLGCSANLLYKLNRAKYMLPGRLDPFRLGLITIKNIIANFLKIND